MRRDTINYFVVGLFVLAIFAAFMYVLYRLTGSSGASDEYYVVYGNVTGINFGTAVYFEGYQIGQVEEITPEFDNGDVNYRLTLSVLEDWEIQSDAVAEIVASGLLAAVSIDIKQGNSQKILSPGDTITGKGIENIFTAVNEIARELRDLTKNTIKPFIDNLNQHVDLLSADIRGITSDQLRPMLSDQVSPLLNKLNRSADRLGDILSEDNIDSIDRMLVNLEAASAEANILVKNLEQTRQDLNTLLYDVDSVVEENRDELHAAVKDMEKTLDAISLHIDAITHNLENSSRNIQEFTRSIRENPGVLLRGSANNENNGVE